GLCNAPGTFQRCMMAIFHDMIEKTMEVFMEDFSFFEGIVLGHKISKFENEVDRAKVDVIAKLPHPTSVKGAVLGQRKTKHFQSIHYASKTMTDAQAHYTTTEKELLAVVAEYLAAEHLSRLENPHQDELEKNEITETFPLETLGHKISNSGIVVDRAKVDVITKLPHPTTVKGVRSFLGHVGFYRRFIQDLSKIARPMTHLLEKETPFVFSKDCIDAFETLKKKLTEAPILVFPD
nr:reverse transcriptase domain-containing protein [Tanacetum cinerariifolium]